MKTRTIFLSLLFLTPILIFAQEITPNIGFGKIKLEDFQRSYSDDPDADAIILFDIGHSKFVDAIGDVGFHIQFTREKRILIKNKSGLDYANISIPFYTNGNGESEIVKNIEATTYYLKNGSLQKVSLNKEEIFTEKTTDKWSQKKFAFPNATEGVIIEYKYTLISPFIFQLQDWVYQSSIPTLYSQYSFNMIPFYEYVFLLQGASKFDEYSSKEEGGLKNSYAGIEYRDMVYTTLMKDIPAFKDESYITSVDDYIMKIDFQLSAVNNPYGGKREIMTTYPRLIKSLMNHDRFGKYLNKAEKITKKILSKEVKLKKKSDLEKCQIIINYVKENYNWNGEYRKYAEHSPKEIIQLKRGSSAEINLLLLMLLTQADIIANPVVFSTRDHGKIRKGYPFDNQFNSVLILIEVDGKKFLTDATEPQIPYNRIPLNCMNDQGLVIKQGDPIWVNMYSKINSTNTRKIILRPIPESNEIEVNIATKMTEIEGYLYRGYYENDLEKIKKDLSENEFEEITNVETENYAIKEKPYKLNYQAKVPMEGFDDKLLISPFLNLPPKENLLKQKKRTYPVDFIFKNTQNFGAKILIPEGYQLLDIPENLMINNDLVRIVYDLNQKEGVINITGSVSYKKSIYEAKDYQQLKKHIDIMVDKFNERIVLEKE